MERYYDVGEDELFYTAPLTISRSDMASFRGEILKLVDKLKTTIKVTDPELVACLNIDWFRINSA